MKGSCHSPVSRLFPIIFCIALVGCSSEPSIRTEAVSAEAGSSDATMVARRKRNFLCEICGAGFSTVQELEQHRRTHITCPYCGLVCVDKDEYEAHYEEAHKRMPVSMGFWTGVYVLFVGGIYSLAIAVPIAIF